MLVSFENEEKSNIIDIRPFVDWLNKSHVKGDGWAFTGNPAELMKQGDAINPETRPNDFVKLRRVGE